MLREIQHSSLDGPRARGEKYLSCRKSSCVKEWDWSALVFAKFLSRADKLPSNNALQKIPIINRGCNAFRYSPPSVQKISNSIFYSEGTFGGKTIISFLCWFSFFAFILENYFRSLPVLPNQNRVGKKCHVCHPPTWATKSSLCAVIHLWPGC